MWTLKKEFSGGVSESVRERNLCAHIQALFLPCQVTLRWIVSSWAWFLSFGKLGMWLAGEGISDEHQRKENFDIFIQLWGREEDLFQSPVAPNRGKFETSISHCALSVTITALWKSALVPSEQISMNEAKLSPKDEGTRKEKMGGRTLMSRRKQATPELKLFKREAKVF